MSRAAKGGHSDGHGGEEAWVIPYADLITLLLGLFILLYASADSNAVKMDALARGLADAFNVGINQGTAGDSFWDGGTGFFPELNQAGQIDFDLERIRQVVDQQSLAAGVSGRILVSRDEDRITIRLADNLLFASASADVRSEAVPLLRIVAAAVNQTTNEVRVEGHTDAIPLVTDRYPSNWELSSGRATAVLRLLTEELGVDPDRTFAAGYGEFRPIANNLTPEGRAMNRRADIVLLYPPVNIDNSARGSSSSVDGEGQAVAPGVAGVGHE